MMTARRLFPRKPRGKRGSQSVLLALVGAAVLVASQWYRSNEKAVPRVSAPEGQYVVQRVVDGDTLLLSDKTKVRLIGANTPETVKPNSPVEPWGPQASHFTRQMAEGRTVQLEFDGQRTDKYGRMLAYVWIDGRMLNEELIRQGLARAETQYHFRADRKALFLAAEREAQSARRGIWSNSR